MKNRRIKDVDFDWDRILSLQGDTGPYLQNVLARIYGIFAKAPVAIPEKDGQGINTNLLTEDKALHIVNLLGEFPRTVRESVSLSEPAEVTEKAISCLGYIYPTVTTAWSYQGM